jgi:eukaryotic-like serine/threonine-protein kinase
MSMPAADRLVADRYALRAPLGRGGMGVVWRAQDAVLGREVAVKEVVFPPTMPDEERRPAQARVMREARAAARLNHPGAVTLYDVVQDRGGTFIVMELVEAPTLAEVVRADGPLPPERVAAIGAQVASALEAAHAAGIVHRDVKPGNVMVPERGMAKLADFGIASLQGDPQLTSTGLVIGSPAYMAPEQAKGEESGPPADFWALGATMFYAVEGEPPFDRGTSVATLAAVVNDRPRPPRRAGALTPLITALLSKDPGSRPSGAELRAELGRLAGPRPSPPTEVLPVHGPGRTVPLAAAAQPDPTPVPEAAPDATDSSSEEAVDDREHPSPPSATLPHRGTQQPRVGFPAAPAVPDAEVSSVPEAGAPEAQAAPTPTPPPRPAEGRPTPTSGPSPRPAEVQADPASGSSARGSEVPAFEPASPGFDPDREPPRPLLPPAPAVDRGGRGRMVGVLALLVVLGLVAVLIAVNLRSDGDGDPTAAPATTAAGAGGNQASETTRQATSTTGEPSTTGAPTTTAAGAGLPEGWTTFTNRRGANRVGVPPGFRARTRQSFNATVVEERGGADRVFTVRSTSPANPLPQASRVYRAYAAREFEDFREVRFEEDQTYAGHNGAVVFEYEAVRDGRRVHVSHINLKGRSWGYNVEFIVPADRWDDSQGLAHQFEQAFQALG